MNQVTILLVWSSVFYGAYALFCYECESTKPDMTCVDPIDVSKVPSYECKFQGPTASFSCVAFELFESDGNKHTYKKSCFRKTPQITSCGMIRNSGAFKNVTSCKECETDNCNDFGVPSNTTTPTPIDLRGITIYLQWIFSKNVKKN